MKNPRLHRFAILIAAVALLLIIAGALLSSEALPLPGSPPAAPTNTWAWLALTHRILGEMTGMLTIVLVLWLARERAHTILHTLGWTALVIVLAEAFLGIPASLAVIHALLAPIYFSIIIAIAVFTSNGPEPAEPNSTLRNTSRWMVAFILLQILLGASYRYNVLGVFWHILNAMIVLVLILVAGVLTLRQYPDHPVLRRAAITLLTIVGAQVLLGFATFLVLLMSSQNNPALDALSVTHIANASLTLAAAVALAIQHR